MRKILLFVLIMIVLVIFTFWVFIYEEGEPDVSTDVFSPPVLNEIGSIKVTKSFVNGRYVIKGILTLPDPCYEIESNVIVMESFPEQIRINLTTPRKEGLCAQVLADKTFEVSFQASDQAVITAYLNEQKVELIEE